MKKLLVLPALILGVASLGLSAGALATSHNDPVDSTMQAGTNAVKDVGEGTMDAVEGVGQGTVDAAHAVGTAGKDTVEAGGDVVKDVGEDVGDVLTGGMDNE
jgi:hypothetical protein